MGDDYAASEGNPSSTIARTLISALCALPGSSCRNVGTTHNVFLFEDLYGEFMGTLADGVHPWTKAGHVRFLQRAGRGARALPQELDPVRAVHRVRDAQ